MDAKIARDIISRLNRLEEAVFGAGGDRRSQKHQKGFTGATGGTRLLISRGFFKQARTAPAVKSELEKKGYFYRIQVVQTALNRLSDRSGPLSAFKKDGKKMYVKRK